MYWLNPATDKIDKEGKQFDATDLPVIGTIALFGSSDMDYAFVFFFNFCNHIMYKKKVKRKNILFFGEDKGEDVNEPPTEAKPGCSNSTEAFSNLNESASYREGKLNCMLQ